MQRSLSTILIALVTLLILSPAAHAQFSIPSFTIDGGGGTSTGGVFQVDGTLGQPDASAPLSGGTYSVTGGFWARVDAACRADVDRSGSLAIDDIFVYLNAWFSGCTGQSGPPCNGVNADFDGVGGVSINDIFVFLNAWFAGC